MLKNLQHTSASRDDGEMSFCACDAECKRQLPKKMRTNITSGLLVRCPITVTEDPC